MGKGQTWTEKEINILEKNYPTMGASYVSNILGRSKIGVMKMASKLDIKSSYKHIFATENEINDAMIISTSYSDTLRNMCKVVNGVNLAILKKYCKEYDINVNFKPQDIKKHKTIDEWLVNGSSIGSSKLKDKLYREGLKERKCEKCGQGELWLDNKISLILDHINGINNDNRLGNLQIVCPNCNAALPTHCRGNLEKKEKIKEKQRKKRELNKVKYFCECGEEKSKKSTKCIKCSKDEQRKSERPSYEQLISEIEETNYTKVSKKYGVSDNAIRKWIKVYEKELNILVPYKKENNRNYNGEYSNNVCKCGNEMKRGSKVCRVCYKKEKDNKSNKPSYIDLMIDINELGQTKTSLKYDVSRMTIRRWKEKFENEIK